MMQIFVRHESICQHQPIRFERSTEKHRITLGEILSLLLNISVQEVLSMEFVNMSHGLMVRIIPIRQLKIQIQFGILMFGVVS